MAAVGRFTFGQTAVTVFLTGLVWLDASGASWLPLSETLLLPLCLMGAAIIGWLSGIWTIRDAAMMAGIGTALYVAIYFLPLWFLLGAHTNPVALRHVVQIVAAALLCYAAAMAGALVVARLVGIGRRDA